MGRAADFDVPAVARIDHNCADPVGARAEAMSVAGARSIELPADIYGRIARASAQSASTTLVFDHFSA